MDGQVRSGRTDASGTGPARPQRRAASTVRTPRRPPEATPEVPRAGGEEPGDRVVVVGSGPVAAALRGAWDGTRSVEVLPEREPQSALVGADVVVLVAHAADLAQHAGVAPRDRQAAAVAGAQHTLAAARAVGVRHVVVVSSAVVHGAWPDRPVVHDDDPLPRGADAARDGLVGDLAAVEAVVARASRRRTPLLTVLRPAAIVGPGVDTFVTRHFEAPRLLTVRGAVRPWQFVHVDDVAAAARFAVDHRLTGALTVGAPDVLTPSQVEAAAGMRRVELAPATAFGTAERLHRVGVLPSPASELAFVVYPWTVGADRLTAAGWSARWSSRECLDVLLEGVQGRVAVAGRRMGSRDAAALGAAGAAVALIGTAAVWRQARARRRG
ncbi:NAD-dependent epimerase/dehydratase family protein [Cellulomonas fimi]|uniref:NAD-dependent epimerase/dehydratase family protein n=1 Tax=Cellulomonas fimi TaxID=1708 RepID=UPI00234DDD95|nr:NAD-dependent epimerase/dehydratase family protein [Cellulomonas fimi]MDC7123085.1 NAD-dependent epimerase/dehydratase family protein [Cellulomonas fimi]